MKSINPFDEKDALNKSSALKTQRPNIDDYFLKIASVVAERSTCRRHNVGAIAVKDKHILATAYNGAPSGTKDCLELGCLRDKLKIPSGTKIGRASCRER